MSIFVDTQILISDLDCISKVGTRFFATLCRHLNVAIPSSGVVSFGNINIILIGDFHQLDPIGDRALYLEDHEVRAESQLSAEHKAGHVLYTLFSLTVVLQEQVRVTDPIWLDFLRAIRYGKVTRDHITMLETIVLSVRRFYVYMNAVVLYLNNFSLL